MLLKWEERDNMEKSAYIQAKNKGFLVDVKSIAFFYYIMRRKLF